ncbi:MAG: HAD family hydrolase [Prevotella sp.]|nr:HAD family hydrolase [Prevotella sp.]
MGHIDKGTRAYIFDYGGTLDTGGCHWGKVLWHAYEAEGAPVAEQAFRDAYVYAERTLGKNPIIQSNYTFRQTLAAKIKIEMEWLEQNGIAGLLAGYHQRVLDRVYAQTQHHTAHSREVLRQLYGHSPMVLVSNFYGNIATVLAEFGLDGLFDSIVESAVVGVRKPDPRIFTLGVEALGLPADAVTVVGDSIDKDILPARNAGCQTVWIRGEQWTDAPVDESVPDRIISDISELI